MDVIKITPEELRITAVQLRESASATGKMIGKNLVALTYREAAEKFSKLADKLEADNLDALAFCAPAQGVQA